MTAPGTVPIMGARRFCAIGSSAGEEAGEAAGAPSVEAVLPVLAVLSVLLVRGVAVLMAPR